MDQRLAGLSDYIKVVRSLPEVTGERGDIKLFKDEIQKNNLVDLVGKATVLNTSLYDNRKVTDDSCVATSENLLFIAKSALLFSPLQTGDIISEEKFTRLCLIFNDLGADDIPKTNDREEALKEFAKFTLKKSQFYDLARPATNSLPRSVVIYTEIFQQIDSEKAKHFEDLFVSLTGLTFSDYYKVGFCLRALIQNQHNIIDLEKLDDGPGKAIKEKVILFCKTAGINIADFKLKYTQDWEDRYKLIPFYEHPLIWWTDTKLFCPSVQCLIEKITGGIYHTIFTADPSFSDFYGKAFERYVGYVLSPHFESSQLISEFEYGAKAKRRRTSDWIVGEGKTVHLFECKNKRLQRLTTKETGSEEALITDLKKGVCKAISQLLRVQEDALKGDLRIESIPKIKNFVFLIIIPEALPLAHDPFMADLIEENTLSEYGVSTRDYHVMEIEELECVVAVFKKASKKGLLRLLIEKKRNSGKYRYDSFWNYIVQEFNPRQYSNAVLAKKFHDITSRLAREIFGADSFIKPPSILN